MKLNLLSYNPKKGVSSSVKLQNTDIAITYNNVHHQRESDLAKARKLQKVDKESQFK